MPLANREIYDIIIIIRLLTNSQNASIGNCYTRAVEAEHTITIYVSTTRMFCLLTTSNSTNVWILLDEFRP